MVLLHRVTIDRHDATIQLQLRLSRNIIECYVFRCRFGLPHGCMDTGSFNCVPNYFVHGCFEQALLISTLADICTMCDHAHKHVHHILPLAAVQSSSRAGSVLVLRYTSIGSRSSSLQVSGEPS